MIPMSKTSVVVTSNLFPANIFSSKRSAFLMNGLIFFRNPACGVLATRATCMDSYQENKKNKKALA
tara:strand:- start:52 stop:249 length:198 start_codon:yes stop_codon:yes gene_type:complete